jgi:hypothetical protein
MKKYQNPLEIPENSHCFRYSTKNLIEPPANSRILVMSRTTPIVYEHGNTLCVHANPEFSVSFVEMLLRDELISQNLLSEEGFEIAKKTWENSVQMNFNLIRSVCEGFLFGG